MKSCPCCGSGNVSEYKLHGTDQIKCHACTYDSAEHDQRLFKQKHKDKEKERER